MSDNDQAVAENDDGMRISQVPWPSSTAAALMARSAQARREERAQAQR